MKIKCVVLTVQDSINNKSNLVRTAILQPQVKSDENAKVWSAGNPNGQIMLSGINPETCDWKPGQVIDVNFEPSIVEGEVASVAVAVAIREK